MRVGGSVLDDPAIAARMRSSRRPVPMATGHAEDARALTLLRGEVERLNAAEQLQLQHTQLLREYTEGLTHQANTNFRTIEARLAQFQTTTNTHFATIHSLLDRVAQRLEAIEQQQQPRPPTAPGT